MLLLCRILGLSRGWRKMYCALVPFTQHVGELVTELQLLFIDESALSLTDKVWVTECRAEPCTTRARMHIDLVSPALFFFSCFSTSSPALFSLVTCLLFFFFLLLLLFFFFSMRMLVGIKS